MKFISNHIDLTIFDAVLFDLDNTVYNEELYLFEGYKSIAHYCQLKYNMPERIVFDFLTTKFLAEGRDRLFNTMCEEFHLPEDEIKEFLHILRTLSFPSKLQSFNYFIPTCLYLVKKNIHLGIITNGNVQQQKNKVANLNLDKIIDRLTIIYANEIQPKPDVASFEFIQSLLNFQKAIYIGDSENDILFAKNCRIPFLHVDKLSNSPIYLD